MKTLLKNTIYGGLRAAGVYRGRRRQYQDKAIVLTYHGVVDALSPRVPEYEYRNFVTSRQFEEQIRFLLKHYRPLRVEDFFSEHAELSGGFLITFDDGFRNNFLYAMPILKKYGLQGSFFITTGLIGTRELLWTEQVTRIITNTQRPQVQLQLEEPRTFSLNTAKAREQASGVIRTFMKRQSPLQRDQILARLKEQLNDVNPSVAAEEEDRYLFMTWEEVREMIASGQSIGSHTHSHPILAPLSEADSYRELQHSKELIEAKTGRECRTMSYPNGETADYCDTQIRQLKELGYKCAFTQIPLFNDRNTDRYQLRRVNISLKMTMPVFEAVICGILK